MTIQEAYKQGFIDALRAFAWWKDGIQYVGTGAKTLKDAVSNVEQIFSYTPPKEDAHGA